MYFPYSCTCRILFARYIGPCQRVTRTLGGMFSKHLCGWVLQVLSITLDLNIGEAIVMYCPPLCCDFFQSSCNQETLQRLITVSKVLLPDTPCAMIKGIYTVYKRTSRIQMHLLYMTHSIICNIDSDLAYHMARIIGGNNCWQIH